MHIVRAKKEHPILMQTLETSHRKIVRFHHLGEEADREHLSTEVMDTTPINHSTEVDAQLRKSVAAVAVVVEHAEAEGSLADPSAQGGQ